MEFLNIISTRVYNKKGGKYLRIEYLAKIGDKKAKVIIPKIDLNNAIIKHSNNMDCKVINTENIIKFESCDFIPKMLPNKHGKLFYIEPIND